MSDKTCNKKRRLHLRVECDLYEELNAYAEKTRLAISCITARAIRRYLKERPRTGGLNVDASRSDVA
jgi:hypothetical protein